MKAVGIVVEYNPFHNGHLYHAEEARKQSNADVVIAVMSASFLQRGEPALVSKWARTQMALANGVDIVVELPYVYATQKAEIFASKAVSILSSLGVDFINFGSESGNIDSFLELTKVMKDHEMLYNTFIKEQLNNGVSYPRATAEAFEKLQLDNTILSLQEPNNILGYHYVKAIIENHKHIKAMTTLRKQAHFHDEDFSDASIASATSIRKTLNDKNELTKLNHVVPKKTVEMLQDYLSDYSLFHTWEHYFTFLQYKILSTPPATLRQLYECEEGLEYRAIEMVKYANSFQNWMENMKTKRYTWTRLQRFATHLLLNTTKEEMNESLSNENPPYIRLLGMNGTGQLFLNQTKKDRETPLVTRAAAAKGIIAELEERATTTYYMPFKAKKRIAQIKKEIQRIPIIVK